MYAYDFRKFLVHERLPHVSSTRTIFVLLSTRTIYVRFEYACDLRTFQVRGRFPYVFSTRTIFVRFYYAYDIRSCLRTRKISLLF